MAGLGEGPVGCDNREKDRPLIHARSFLLDVREKGIADVLRERQPHLVARFAAQAQHTGRPIKIAESEPGDIPGSKPQTRQQKQDRPVTPASPGELIAGCNDPINIGGGKVPRQRRKAPLHDWRDGVVEVGAAEAGTGEETEIAAQCARYGPQVGRAGTLAPLADNITDEGCIIVMGRRAELRQQFMQMAKMAGDGPLRQPPVNAQPALIVVKQRTW